MNESLRGEQTPKTAASGFAGQILETIASPDEPLLTPDQEMVFTGPAGAGTIEPHVIEEFVAHNMPPLAGHAPVAVDDWRRTAGTIHEATLRYAFDDASHLGSVAIAELTGLPAQEDDVDAPALQVRVRTTGVVDVDAYDVEIIVGRNEKGDFRPQEGINYELNNPIQEPKEPAAKSFVDLINGVRTVFTLAEIYPEITAVRRSRL